MSPVADTMQLSASDGVDRSAGPPGGFTSSPISLAISISFSCRAARRLFRAGQLAPDGPARARPLVRPSLPARARSVGRFWLGALCEGGIGRGDDQRLRLRLARHRPDGAPTPTISAPGSRSCARTTAPSSVPPAPRRGRPTTCSPSAPILSSPSKPFSRFPSGKCRDTLPSPASGATRRIGKGEVRKGGSAVARSGPRRPLRRLHDTVRRRGGWGLHDELEVEREAFGRPSTCC